MTHLEPHHLADLRRSGLSDETIEKAGFYSASAEEVKEIVGWDPKTPGLAFPYPGTEKDDGKPFIRVKPDTPPIINGKNAKYLSPKGVTNRLYIPPGVEHALKDINVPLIIVEGEKKALKGTQEGLNCIAVSGVWSWRGKGAEGKSQPVPDLDLIEWKGRKTEIVFDFDAPRNSDVVRAIRALAKELARRGAIVTAVTLPGDSDKKVGLDDYLVTHTAEDFGKLPRTDPLKAKSQGNPNRPSQADLLVEIGADLPLFKDQYGECYAVLDGKAVPLTSRTFKRYLGYELYETHQKSAPDSSLKTAINILEAMADRGDEVTLFTRIAEKNGAFFYDLGKGRVVKVTPEGWKVVDEPMLFWRYQHQKAQPDPLPGGNPFRIFKFLNVNEDQKLLILVYVISCFVPEIIHPVLHIHGDFGAAKTFLCWILKDTVDPSKIDVLISTDDKKELIQTITHNHMTCFDNMSSLKHWLSDLFSMVTTGAGFSKRVLYTNDEDFLYLLRRCIVFNGIIPLITRPDLADRTILLELNKIDDSRRIGERELIKAFEEAKPAILGGIFDVLARAMALYPNVKLPRLPRMADFAKWGYAIAEALQEGSGNEFISAYYKNIGQQTEELIDQNTLAQAVMSLMEHEIHLELTLGEAFQRLKTIASAGDDTGHGLRDDPSFPRTLRSLRPHLKRIKRTLEEKGITYSFGRRKGGGYPITFTSVGSPASPDAGEPHDNEEPWEDPNSGPDTPSEAPETGPPGRNEPSEPKQEELFNIQDGYL